MLALVALTSRPALAAPPKPIYDAHKKLQAELAALPFEHAADLSSREAFIAWQLRGKKALHDVLGVKTATGAANVRTLETRQLEDGLRLEKIDYLVQGGLRIPAYLFFPPNLPARAPAVVLLHGHGDGGKEAIAGFPPHTIDVDEHQAAARQTALAGYIVLAPDIRTFGETGGWVQHHIHAGMNILAGRTSIGQFVSDAKRALDVLESDPRVDPTRLAIGGHSLGGQVSLLTAALDERVKVAIIQNYLASLRGTYYAHKHDACAYVPGLGRVMDISDVAMLSAPRPIVFAKGYRDEVFDTEGANAAYDQLRRGYELVGGGRATLLVRHLWGHSWWQSAATDWLGKHL